MKKQQINFRASVLTVQQLEELSALWGTSQTETITVAIDRIYRQEKDNSDSPKRPNAKKIKKIVT